VTGQRHNRRIIHVTASLSRRGGGIPPVIWSLAQHARRLGCESVVSGLMDEKFEMDCRHQSAPVIAGAVRGPRVMAYSPELRQVLGDQIHSTHVLPPHGLWIYPGTLAFQLSQRGSCKRLVSPHGMLEPWALNHSRCKTRVASWLFETRNLRTAGCLHALCGSGTESFRRYGVRNSVSNFSLVDNICICSPIYVFRSSPVEGMESRNSDPGGTSFSKR
jgi:hypothetical protein